MKNRFGSEPRASVASDEEEAKYKKFNTCIENNDCYNKTGDAQRKCEENCKKEAGLEDSEDTRPLKF